MDLRPAALPAKSASRRAASIRDLAGWDRAYPASAISIHSAWLLAGRNGSDRKIAIGYPAGKRPRWLPALRGVEKSWDGGAVLLLEGDHATLLALRQALPHLAPRAAGNTPSFGFGDRTGLATPGHLASLGKSGFFPVLAQQSTREMTRTQRSPDEVMDAAVFGVLQAGWLSGWGADADHLKTPEEIRRTAAAGFVMFTLDAADFVEDKAGQMSDPELAAGYAKIVAEVPGAKGWERAYEGKIFKGGGRAFREAAVKYGRAIQHWVALEKAARQATRGRDCEIEVSGDETSTPTSPAEHRFIIRELKARGADLDSLAPRFLGDFEKGIDYKGDLRAFAKSAEEHAAIAKALGGYKISVHSGSDKFSIYPAVARATKGRFHLKTAGTSWLEALRAVARKDAALFREVVDYSRGRFAQDSASYFISGRPEDAPPPAELDDAGLERVYLDENAGRQVLHVTYGSVLTLQDGGTFRFRNRIFELLAREEETYFTCLEKHLGRHVKGLVVRKAKTRAAAGARR